MDPKPRPNQELYSQVLKRMTPEQRVAKALELSEFSRQALLAGLRARHPRASEEELRAAMRERLQQCHNKNY